MGTNLEVPGQGRFAIPKWLKIGALVAVFAILVLVIFRSPQIKALYEMYWSQAEIEKLFYEDLGVGKSWSAFIAVVLSFLYGLAWIPLSAWTSYRILLRFNKKQVATAFLCWVFIYGHAPFLHAVLGNETCFNQRTGEPTKWYVQDSDGRIVLFDSPGFDSATGVAKHPVTTPICTTFAGQKKNDRPRRITVDARQIEFFDANTGRAQVWYAKSDNGPYELFDANGYHPTTSEPLRPVTKEVVSDIVKQVMDQEAARILAEEQRKAAEEKFRRRAEEQGKAAEAEERKHAEEMRRQAEIEAQRRVEEQRQKEAAEAQKRLEEEKRQAAEARKRAEADAQRRAEEQRLQAEAAERKRAEDKAVLDSYVRTSSGAMCRNEVRAIQTLSGVSPEAICSCGSYYTRGPCQ
jgi:hypothetical protein